MATNSRTRTASRTGETAMADVNDSARYLVNQGIADPQPAGDRRLVLWRLCGAAVGGDRSDLYKAVVAIAPVTDLGLLKQEAEDYTNAELVKRIRRHRASMSRQVAAAERGGDQGAGAAGPWRSRYQRRRRPQRARWRGAARRRASRSSSCAIKDLDHQLDDSNARAEMLTQDRRSCSTATHRQLDKRKGRPRRAALLVRG